MNDKQQERRFVYLDNENQVGREEFNKSVVELLSYQELCNLNETIYHNPLHIEYFIMYKEGRYQECLEYLKNHRHMLS